MYRFYITQQKNKIRIKNIKFLYLKFNWNISPVNFRIIVQNWNMSQVCRKILAEKIKKYRMEAGYTKEQLSLMLKKDNSYISKLENLRINISVDILEEIINLLNKKIEDFFVIK